MLYFMLIEDLTRRRVRVCGKHQAEHFQTSVQFLLSDRNHCWLETFKSDKNDWLTLIMVLTKLLIRHKHFQDVWPEINVEN